MLTVREVPKIESRPPKAGPGRGRRICDTRSPWKHKKESFFLMSAGFLWIRNDCWAVCIALQNAMSFTISTWFSVKSLVASALQNISQ